MNVPFTKNVHSFFQGPSNPGFRSVKVQTETFLIRYRAARNLMLSGTDFCDLKGVLES